MAMIVGSAAGRGAPVEQASGKGRAVDLTAGELGVDRGDSDLGVAVQVLTWLAQQYLDPDDDGPVDLWLALRSGLDVLPGCPNTPTPPSLLVAVADRLRGAVRGGGPSRVWAATSSRSCWSTPHRGRSSTWSPESSGC